MHAQDPFRHAHTVLFSRRVASACEDLHAGRSPATSYCYAFPSIAWRTIAAQTDTALTTRVHNKKTSSFLLACCHVQVPALLLYGVTEFWPETPEGARVTGHLQLTDKKGNVHPLVQQAREQAP